MKKLKLKKINFKNKKKVFILCGFCLLLLVTGGLNLYISSLASSSSEVENASTITSANFFSNYRDDRTTTRAEEILCLDAIINNSTSEEAVANATKEKADLIAKMEMILELENQIKAKGFDDVVVSALSSNISIMVKSEGLTSNEVSQIVDIVLTNTNYLFDNIKISEI